MKFSVIIATRDRALRLDAALASLRLQGQSPPVEIVVVDNGSSDATREVVERHGARYVYEAVPNRGLARNRGVAAADGSHLLFVDDDVVVPAGFIAVHARAHQASVFPRAVTGPIVNVPSASDRPSATWAHYSRAFFCTCNASVPAAALRAVGGFDERFHLYGWEDTELGLRLRQYDVERVFEWDAYLWHVKSPHAQTLEAALEKAFEKAQMAARFVQKAPTVRAKLATGAYRANFWRAKALAPRAAQAWFAGMATSPRVTPAVARFARGRLLDSVYAETLERELEHNR